MRRSKILTIDDLVRFCQDQNFTQFSSKESGYSIYVQIPCESFEATDDEDPLTFYGNVKLMHTGLNRNKSNLTEKGAKSCLSKIAYKPVLADFTEVNGERDFTSHSMEFNEDGSRTYIEKQVGCFTSDMPYMKQDPEHEDRQYIYAKVAIPREYTDAAEIIERKGGTKVSAELCINEMSYSIEDGLLLEDVDVMGCTLLGTDPDTGKEVQEGMQGAYLQIEDFSADNNSVINKAQLKEEILAEIMSQLSDIKAFAENSKEGGKPKEMGKFNELLAKYNKTIDDITFEYENMSDEELEVAFADAFETAENLEDSSSEENVVEEETPVVETESSYDASTGAAEKTIETVEEFADGDTSGDNDSTGDTTGDTTEGTDTEDDVDNTDDGVLNNGQQGRKTMSINGQKFEVSLSEIQWALYELVNNTYSDTDNDYYSVEVYEGSKTVVMSGMFSGKSYKQSYKVRNGVYSLTGDRISVKPVFVTADEEAELDRMRSNYSSIEEKLQKYESEPEKMDILNSSDYANIADQANFNELKKQENHFDLTVDEVKEKADAMLLQYAKSGKLNFAVNEQPKDEPKKDFFAFARVEHNTSFLDGLLKSRK